MKHEEKLALADHRSALLRVIEILSKRGRFDCKAIGHRVAHGGEYFREPELVTDTVIEKIEELAVWHLSTIRLTRSAFEWPRNFSRANRKLPCSIPRFTRRYRHTLFTMPFPTSITKSTGFAGTDSTARVIIT